MYDWYDANPTRGTTCCNQFAGQIILMAGGPNLAGISQGVAGYSRVPLCLGDPQWIQ